MAKPATGSQPNVVRVAMVWGTTVVALKTLARGKSFHVGDAAGASLPIPEGIEMATTPVRAAVSGWELDARGCLGGLLTLGGRAEDPVAIARVNSVVPITPGDFGLIQYGQIALFFQCTTEPIKLATFRGPELLVVLAALCSAILHVGGMGLLSTLSTPLPYPKPPELESPDDLASRFKIKRAALELATVFGEGDKAEGAGTKSPRIDDTKMSQGQATSRGREGKLGTNKTFDRTSLPAELKPATHYGGLIEVLEGDTGREIQSTLKSIRTVSGALSGLNSKDLVVGGAAGISLRGATSGGSNGPEVAFGAGALDTGFGGRGSSARVASPDPRRSGGIGKGGPDKTASEVARTRPSEPRAAAIAGAAAANGGLSPEQIQRVVMSHIGAVRACFEIEVQRDPALNGRVTLEWQIAPGGNVTRASVRASTLASPRVEGCMVRQVQKWKFPASDLPTTVAGFPFKFGVGG